MNSFPFHLNMSSSSKGAEENEAEIITKEEAIASQCKLFKHSGKKWAKLTFLILLFLRTYEVYQNTKTPQFHSLQPQWIWFLSIQILLEKSFILIYRLLYVRWKNLVYWRGSRKLQVSLLSMLLLGYFFWVQESLILCGVCVTFPAVKNSCLWWIN